MKQLENIIEYCDYNSKHLKLTNRISNGFKIAINKITIPLTTFLGGIALTKYEIALEYILVIWITIVMVTFGALGVIYTIKIASE